MQLKTDVKPKPFNYKKWFIGSLVILAIFIYIPTFIAGPDGLERVMENHGVEAPEPIWQGVLPDYSIPGIEDPWISSLLAGVIGSVIMLVVVFGVLYLIQFIRNKKSKPAGATSNN